MIYEIPNSDNCIDRLETFEDFKKYWPLFLTGLHALNDPSRANMGESVEDYTKLMLNMTLSYPNGMVAVMVNNLGKPIAFGSAYNSSIHWQTNRTLHIYALYALGEDLKAASQMLVWTEMMARQNGYNKVSCQTGRINGGAMRFFEDKLGFSRKHIVFQKEI